MEYTSNLDPGGQALKTETVAENPPKVRIFSILWRLLIVVAIIAGAIYLAMNWISNKPEPVQRQARERSFTVVVQPALRANHSVAINTFGTVVAARTIDMRAQVTGEVVALSPNLVAGGELARGERLIGIDSFNYDGALTDAKGALADAQVQLKISKEQLNLETLKLNAAKAQLDLAERDLQRARALAAAGSLTDKALEDRELIVSQRAQAMAQNASNIEVQRANIERQLTAINRSEWGAAQAERALRNTQIFAPFDAVVMNENAELGRLFSTNEVIAQLYERDALEVRFTLTDRQYGQLLSDGLQGRPIDVSWEIDPAPIHVTGTIARTGAEVNAALGGVEVFAQLLGTSDSGIRPGAFVKVSIKGPVLEQSFRIAETAVYENTHLYVVQDGRMKRVGVEILGRDGAELIVAGTLPKGAQIITSRLAQAGEGLRVAIEGEDSPLSLPSADMGDVNAPRSGTQKPNSQTQAAGQAGGRPAPLGAVRNEDGSITLPNGRTRFPDGRVVDADGRSVQRGQNQPAGRSGPLSGQ